ncbi:MAG: large protein, partial [Chitinophagaceae bacterium]|nr:large protein [Chitinophagaceae bacterium]
SDYQCVAVAPVPTEGSNYIAVTNNPGPWNRNYWWGSDHSSTPSNFLIADGTSGRVWMQTVNVVAGQQYNFSIWARNLVNPNTVTTDINPPTVSIRVNNTVLATSPPLVQAPATSWTQVSAVYTATTTGSVTLNVFQNVSTGFNDIGIDDISFTNVNVTPMVSPVASCNHASVAITASGAAGTTTYSWYNEATGGSALFTGNPFLTPALTENTTYWVALYEPGGCESKRVPATVTVSEPPVVTSTTNANRCDCGVLTLTASGNAGIYSWYDVLVGGSAIATGNSFTTPSICSTTTYYVSVTNSSGCISERKPAIASVNCESMLLFDGTDDRVTIPHHAAYNIGSGDFTLEALVNIPAGAIGSYPVFSKRTSGFDGFLLYSYGNRLLLQMSGVPNYQSGFYTTINDGTCHHIAVTRSGTSILFYIDGTIVGGATAARSLNSLGSLYIGHDEVDRSHLKGAINEARFWNKARTATEISANAYSLNADHAGLIGLWNFNEAGQEAVDGSITANNGLLGTNNTVESSDPARTLVECNSVNRQESTNDEINYTENTALNVTVSPNPFTAQTTVSVKGLSSSEGSYHVEVYNMHGLLTLSKEVNGNEEIVLGNELAAGMYMVKVTENGTSQTVKIIKE